MDGKFPGTSVHLSMSQMPWLSSSCRLMGMEGLKCPKSPAAQCWQVHDCHWHKPITQQSSIFATSETACTPVTQSPGISQMRKKPRMWSMRSAEKYLHSAMHRASTSLAAAHSTWAGRLYNRAH